MKKGILILILLILALFSVSCIYAADVNDTLAASEDTGEIELSHEIESADDNLGTSEEQTVTQTDSEEKTGATDDGTFEALKSKIGSASSGDTVYLENDYSCEDSWIQKTGIDIDTSNLVIDGQGHTIDAKQKTRIFDVYFAENVTIKNIKFINAKVHESSGGAIYWSFSDKGSVSGCSFVNCSAGHDGGAIEWSLSNYGSVSGCSFVNCSTVDDGGAIYWDGSANGNISDCVFINSTASEGRAIYMQLSSASLDRNWFGNTAENYKTSPNAYIYGAGLGNWLFLNATVDPDSISIAETADIIFKLYLYNGSITDYTSLAKVDLTLNSNGKLDKNVTGLDEKVTFTPTSLGTGSVTATIGDVAYTTTLTVTTDGTTFWDLNQTINGNTNDTITLDKDYAYNPASDSAFIGGIDINGPVTINGNGYTIDAKGKTRIFYVASNDVVLENITFINGNNTAGSGGAVYFEQGATGSVENCNFTNNTALYGGAILINGIGTVTNCTFTNNYASQGGAIWFSRGTVTNCNFIGNTASYGGAIESGSLGTTHEVRNCNFINNTATYYGGAIRLFSGTVTNCNFTDNNATRRGGAVYFKEGATGSVENCNFTDNSATEHGGAVYFSSNGTVTNCNFTNNSARFEGGAIYINSGNVTNCTFTNNTASQRGGAVQMSSGSVENCNFSNNKAIDDNGRGGAVYFLYEGAVSNCNFGNNAATVFGGAVYFHSLGSAINCNFTNNRAYGGAVYFNNASNVTNCNFMGNNATFGSAIYFENSSAVRTISNSTFLNNRADAKTLEVTINENNIIITFIGNNNLLNAIYSRKDAEVTFTNVTYWSANGISSTGILPVVPSRSRNESGQNITVGVVVNDELVLSGVKVTDENGMIVLDISAGDNYYVSVIHDTDSYYTEAEKTISNNTKFNVNVTSQTTHNRTVNITAKSNIPNDVVKGELLFFLPNGANITATYAGNGTWWAVHTFDGYADYPVNATFVGLDNVTITNATISISIAPTEITVENTTVELFVSDFIAAGATLTPADAGNLTFTSNNITVAKVEDGKIIAVGEGTAIITVSFAGNDDYEAAENKTITVNVIKHDSKVSISPINDTVYPNNVTIKYSIDNRTNVTVTIDGVSGDRIVITNDTITVIGLDAGEYTITIINNESDLYYKSNDTKSFTVNKQATSITAADVSTTYNVNKELVITLKDGNGNALRGVKVTVDLNGAKTLTTDENGQVKVSTKGLAPKAYTAKITFNGNTNYAKSTKDVKVTVKKATPKLAAKKKTFKTSVKTKKYTVTLKDNTGKAIKKAKVTLKVKGKTYKATTNSKGKATFKIKKLNKKGTFKATVTYKGNKYYNKATKKAKIKVIVTFKTVSKGSKDKSTVKEIQQALKNNGYYLTYDGHYLKIDGIYHGCTERSVKEFQHDKGLKVTGKVDEKTAKKLGLI